MADISLCANGKYRVRFYRDKKRESIMLATANRSEAGHVAIMLERILAQERTGEVDRTVANWLDTIPQDLKKRLAKAGLIKLEEKLTLNQAGLPLISSLPTNMRGSCSTDLKEKFPEHVVDGWLGHSTEIAHKHYDVITAEHYKNAVEQHVFPEK